MNHNDVTADCLVKLRGSERAFFSNSNPFADRQPSGYDPVSVLAAPKTEVLNSTTIGLHPDYPDILYLILDADEGYRLVAVEPWCFHVVYKQIISELSAAKFRIDPEENPRGILSCCKSPLFVESNMRGDYFIL